MTKSNNNRKSVGDICHSVCGHGNISVSEWKFPVINCETHLDIKTATEKHQQTSLSCEVVKCGGCKNVH